MHPLIGTVIVLSLVGAMVGGIVYSMIRDRKSGKSGCSCGCAGCKLSCPSRQKTEENSEKPEENAPEKTTKL